jgi:serine/threonine protein kinase
MKRVETMREDKIRIGSVLGGFEIEKELGRGGMGVVYLAHELSLNRKVALKVLSQQLSSDTNFIKRFKREARIIAALAHPNIVNILSYGEEQGRYYFAMEYIKGKDLGQILKEERSLPLEKALAVTAQIASALAEAGPRGVVHRDLKPSNIMIDDMGEVKVTDFGVAHFEDSSGKLTQTGLFLGTPEYASPEQATASPLDVRSDIYALGAILYRMLSGKPPVSGDSPLAVVTKIVTEPITPIEQINSALPKSVCDLIGKMMAKNPGDRFQTPKEMLAAVHHCKDTLKTDIPFAETKIQTVGAESPSPQSSRVKLWGSILGVALAVVLIVWLVEGSFRKKEPLDQQIAEEVPPRSPGTSETSDEISAPISSKVSTINSDVNTVESAAPDKPAVKLSDQKSGVLPEGTALQADSAPVKKDSVAKIGKQKKEEALPKIPTVLLVVSGDESMVPLFRVHLESIVMESGLKVASISEIPMLQEKMQFGRIPMTWHVIQPLVPKGKAHFLVLVEVQKTGSIPLKYYGRVQQMETATFAVRAVDMDRGISVATTAGGSVKYTHLNLEENIRDAIGANVGDVGKEIKAHWEKKLAQEGKPG